MSSNMSIGSKSKTSSRKIAPQKTPRQLALQTTSAFNTWAFKREQPSDSELLVQVVETAITREDPISFALYWGKGPRSTLGSPDLACLSYLTGMANRIEQNYENGAVMNLVFTDTHARLNGHSEDVIDSYFSDVADAADPSLFRFHRLATLVEAVEATHTGWSPPDPETLKRLEACAAKWFRGEGSSEEGALTYFGMNMIEKQVMAKSFPGSIFATFNGSEYRTLFPDNMPIFYMYSLKKGFSVKPWFMPDLDASSQLDCRAA
ncbi:MAG: hypothetical protein AB7O43_10395 [Hyphomicrobiaceae bacterium]